MERATCLRRESHETHRDVARTLMSEFAEIVYVLSTPVRWKSFN